MDFTYIMKYKEVRLLNFYSKLNKTPPLLPVDIRFEVYYLFPFADVVCVPEC